MDRQGSGQDNDQGAEGIQRHQVLAHCFHHAAAEGRDPEGDAHASDQGGRKDVQTAGTDEDSGHVRHIVRSECIGGVATGDHETDPHDLIHLEQIVGGAIVGPAQ